MSLLIDALKKHRQESTSATSPQEVSIAERIPMSKVKKIVFISSITVIVISLTAIASFLLFKHFEKKRMTQIMQAKTAQIQKVKALLASDAGGAASGSGEAAGEVRAKLQQKMEQAQANNNSTPVGNAVSSAPAEAASVADASVATSTGISTTVAPTSRAAAMQGSGGGGSGALRARLAQRQAGNSQNNADASTTDSDSNSDSDSDSSSDSNSNDQADTTSDDSAATNTTSAPVDDASSASDASAGGDTSSTTVKKVDIQVVPDQLGANNTTYQKALSYMQKNQYSQALALLEDNDDVLLKTQGLSTLLLARIYLSTGQYVLANDALDRALMLHAGSDVELIGLKAQVFFMQKQYQEAVDTLSSQSPDLSASPEYYTLLANAYMHLNQPGNAASVFEQIVARFPDSANYWLGLAVAYQKNGDANSALVAYHRAAQLSPDDPQVMLFIDHQIAALQVK